MITQNDPTLSSNKENDFFVRTMKDDLLSKQTSTPNTVPSQNETVTKFPVSLQAKSEPRAVSEMKSPSPFEAVDMNSPKKNEAIDLKIKEDAIVPEENNFENENSSSKKTIIFFIGIFCLVILGLGAYYFWLTNNTQKTQPAEQEIISNNPLPENQPQTEQQSNQPILEKYSQSKPNYLVLDLANLSVDNLRKSILTVSEEIKNLPNQEPGTSYEFIIVDINNNPITFQIFATATGLNLSENMLGALGNDFYLYFNNESGAVHLGLNISVKDKNNLSKEMILQEKSLAKDISFLFLNDTAEKAAGEFKDGSYNGQATRYLNLNMASSFSIDYALTTTHLSIGTSKNTLRSILDKNVSTSQKLGSGVETSPSLDNKNN